MTGGSIKISVQGDKKVAFDCELVADEPASYPKWTVMLPLNAGEFISRLETKGLAPRRGNDRPDHSERV